MVFSRPEGAFFAAICWLNVANSCSSRSRSSTAATTKVAAEQLTAGAGQQDGHVDTLPRAAKSWKFVFFNWGFRRDARPRGLSLQGTIPSLSAMVFSRPGGVFFAAICWLNDLANSCSSRSRSSTAATTKVAAEQLTAGAGQQDVHVDKLPRAAKSWKFVFFNGGFRRDVRPRGLSLQGTIPSLSAMVFSRPGGAFFAAICWLNDVANSCSRRSRSSAAATTKVAAEQLPAGAGQQDGHVDKLPRAAKSWKFVSFNWGFRRDVRPRGLSL